MSRSSSRPPQMGTGCRKGLPVQLERMAQSEGGQALDELLREERRTLQSWQRETVLAHFERCGLPLYLKLAAEESRLWKSYAPEVLARWAKAWRASSTRSLTGWRATPITDRCWWSAAWGIWRRRATA